MSSDPYDKYAGPEDERKGRQNFREAMKDPFLAGVWAKIHSKPQTPKPPPEPCIRCGAMLERIPEYNAWIPEPCVRCGRHKVVRDARLAREKLVKERVQRDLGVPLEKLLRQPIRPLLKGCLAWLEEGYPNGAWLYLYGPPGRGKTSQAIALAYELHRMVARSGELIEHEWQLHSIADLSPDARITYATTREILASTKSPEWRDVSWWENRRLLIIDEVGRDTALSPTDVKVLAHLYDARWRMDKMTILISNYHPVSELPQRNETWADETMHQRILQQIGGIALTWAVDFTGQPNWRLK